MIVCRVIVKIDTKTFYYDANESYGYHQQSKTQDIIYLRCINDQCEAKATFKESTKCIHRYKADHEDECRQRAVSTKKLCELSADMIAEAIKNVDIRPLAVYRNVIANHQNLTLPLGHKPKMLWKIRNARKSGAVKSCESVNSNSNINNTNNNTNNSTNSDNDSNNNKTTGSTSKNKKNRTDGSNSSKNAGRKHQDQGKLQ